MLTLYKYGQNICSIIKLQTSFQEQMPTILRPISLFTSSSSSSSSHLTSALSSEPTVSSSKPHIANVHSHQTNHDSIKGNRIINMDAMSEALYRFNLEHENANPKCIPYPYWPSNYETQWGLGIGVKIGCKLCGFICQKDSKLYEEILSFKQGQSMAKLNLQSVLHVFKSSVAYNDIALIFASIDCNYLSERHFYRIVNKIAPLVTELGQNAIKNNRSIIKVVAAHNPSLLGGNGMALIPSETDTLFNNPPKGRVYSSPGTQSVTPTMEKVTNRKLIISISPYNQLCSKHNNLCDHTQCGLNYSADETIDSTERKSAKRNYEEMFEDNIQVKRLCHDGITGSRHLAGMRDASEKYGVEPPNSSPCTAHLKRNTTKQMAKVRLSEQALNGCPRVSQIKYKNAIAHHFANRASWEVTLAFKKFGHDGNIFVAHNLNSKTSIVPCSMGHHDLCKKYSLVCNGENKPFPKQLPGKQYLKLTQNDQDQINKYLIDYRMSSERLKLQQYLEHTNRVESYHRSTLKLCPKHKTYRRNYVPRCHSAAHTDSKGILEAMMELADSVGVSISSGGKGHAILKKMHKKIEYLRMIRCTVQHKRRVRLLRIKKAWLRAHRCLSLVSTVTPSETLHDY